MKLRSPTDKPLHVALLSGHTTVISPDGDEVPKMFLREAVARGAVPVDDEPASSDMSVQILSRQLAIRETLTAMIAGKDKEDFTGDGKPNLVRLKSKAGFAVTREEADTIFAELAKEQAGRSE